MEGTIRAFVALRLDERATEFVQNTVAAVCKLAEDQGVKASWSRHPHLTLLFLGRMEEADVPEAAVILQERCRGHRPMSLSIGGIGAFPSMSRPRVVWLGLGGELEALRGLQRRIRSGIAQLGDHSESKEFNPHITLGRIKPSSNAALRGFSEGLEALSVASTSIELESSNVDLMESRLSPKGASYTVRASAILGAA